VNEASQKLISKNIFVKTKVDFLEEIDQYLSKAKEDFEQGY
jgi:hypothetical protein